MARRNLCLSAPSFAIFVRWIRGVRGGEGPRVALCQLHCTPAKLFSPTYNGATTHGTIDAAMEFDIFLNTCGLLRTFLSLSVHTDKAENHALY